MKILPAVVFFLIGFISVQSSFSQDSTAQSYDTSVHIKPVPKKQNRHKRVLIDSTAGQPARHERVLNDSTVLPIITMTDTSIPVQPVPVRTVKYRHLFTDSAYYRKHPDTVDRNLTLPLNPEIHIIARKKAPRRKIFISDSLTADDSLKYSLLLIPLSEAEMDALRESVMIRDSLKLVADSTYADSVNRHWAGWKKYQIQPRNSYTLYSKGVLKGKSKAELQYNIADFYLYLNGRLVKPPKSASDFFAAGCLCFKYDDTLLLNSGLGFKVGVGVGIKLIDGRFTSALHANTHNQEIYKLSKEDTSYIKSVMAEPVVQSLKLKTQPAYASNEIIIGEYRASYKKFYQKNDDDEEDEPREYTVRIIFRCRVTGGIDSMKSLSGTNSK
jgi:hypothetical protein